VLAELTTHILQPWLYTTLPFWPFIGAVFVGLMLAFGWQRKQAHWPVVLGVAASAILAIFLFFELGRTHAADAPTGAEAIAAAGHDGGDAGTFSVGAAGARAGETQTLFRWMSFGSRLAEMGRWIEVNFFFDTLTGVMLFTVTIVSLMVVIYSIGYMRDHHGHPERGYERFFAFLGLFVFSMCMLVLAGNFVLLYLGWELVGLCSYLLIGFYYKKPEAAAAAKKAFIVNRIGDFGFALGIFSIYMFVRGYVQPGENPLDYAVVFKYAAEFTPGQLTLVSLLLMCGALGKSAQFPLYVWLPDAMEGPSPVSALIHAATMVTAGMYMVARCWPIFSLSTTALSVIVVLGVIGAFMAATMAMAQYDMKRILAYSTISQLAYMFVALGVGVPDSAIFHLFTHAFFKALLFLCAGSVMHAMGGIIDLRRFSGLRRILPRTYWLTLAGCLALAGFPLFSGFWSKDEIVHACFNYHWLVGAIMLLTAAMTAYYTFRMFFLCFHGPTRLPEEAGEHPHESPPVMIRPLVVLAIGAIFAGYAGVGGFGDSLSNTFLFLKPHGYFHHYLHASTLQYEAHTAGSSMLMYISAAIAILGILLAWARYGEAPAEDPDQRALGDAWNLWHAKYYVDEIYDYVFVRPLRRLGNFFFAADNNGIDGVIWFVTAIPRAAGAGLRFLQQGALQGYALGMAIGLVALLLLWRWMDTAMAG